MKSLERQAQDILKRCDWDDDHLYTANDLGEVTALLAVLRFFLLTQPHLRITILAYLIELSEK